MIDIVLSSVDGAAADAARAGLFAELERTRLLVGANRVLVTRNAAEMFFVPTAPAPGDVTGF